MINYDIYVIEMVDGKEELTRAFSWAGRMEDGMAVARREARRFGRNVIDVYASPFFVEDRTVNGIVA